MSSIVKVPSVAVKTVFVVGLVYIFTFAKASLVPFFTTLPDRVPVLTVSTKSSLQEIKLKRSIIDTIYFNTVFMA